MQCNFDSAKQGRHQQLASVGAKKKDCVFAALMMHLPGTAGESEHREHREHRGHREHREQIFRKWEEAYQVTKRSANDKMLAYRDMVFKERSFRVNVEPALIPSGSLKGQTGLLVKAGKSLLKGDYIGLFCEAI